ncbi:unnamed protein product, partial [Staurois parvus]
EPCDWCGCSVRSESAWCADSSPDVISERGAVKVLPIRYSYFNKAHKGFLKMASSSRTQVLNLYKIMLRESQKFSSYNYRTHATRRIRDAFREKKNIDDSHEVQTLVCQAKENLDIIRRQVRLGILHTCQTFNKHGYQEVLPTSFIIFLFCFVIIML